MTLRMILLGLVLGGPTVAVRGQGMAPAERQMSPAQAANPDMQSSDDTPQMDPAQQKAAKTFAQKPHVSVAHPPIKSVVLTPLSQRERVQQMLDRFTFGARPGEVDQVVAMGAGQWLAQQMSPETIKDPVLDKRLAVYPTLTMPTTQMITVFPDRAQIGPVADGKVPYPVDPLLNAVYEVQVYKLLQERDQKNPDGSVKPKVELTDAEKAERKKRDQATATRIAGDLLVLPKQQRMAALIKMPVEDRIAFTANGNLSGNLHDLLFADFTPRERETFNAMSPQVNSSYNIGSELAQARILRDVLSERQLQEVMTDFWFNHFNVYIAKDSDEWYTTSYERDVIRKNALGNFRDLLMATAKSPAMMVYLDNWLSIGPDSIANGVNPQNPNSKKGNKGLNENYGREVMELHTVGVNGGYTQSDVTALSAILTGWGVDRPNQGGPFLFDPKRHEPGPKTWFGYVIDDNGNVAKASASATSVPGKTVASDDSMKQGIAALNILASSPKTAHFISLLLAQHFVADTPPPALVDRLAKVYLSSNGDIKSLLRELIASPEFNSRQYFHNKVKTPVEFVASAFRSTATEPQNPGALVNTIKTMGMPMYYALPPTGYYLTADQWMNSSALVDRLNFAYQLTNGKFANQKFDAPKLLAMGLLTPTGAGSFAGGAPKTAGTPAQAAHGDARFVGVSASVQAPAVAGPAGVDIVLRVLEGTMIGAPVSAQTNQLIDKQIDQQPANANSTDTLNLLTALVMGAPEFQLR
ncbi:DUF1800 domain-containing protein [Granulicella mallensis]|uniref:DUF1800 domain-containing protein n=1 Tax=Granulicella mallensis (strain ATCC BAA-1857 / DSM 23137 / MP5ACTX8) TaxID=682795 RepID=G8NNZ1_GRAMM|nr:DUF1800 domain-containing protein [Granulicella mallensis]AEU37095.1 protein of unknown function DUF1800 [Granulicella mallensis MP5ACTX8]